MYDTLPGQRECDVVNAASIARRERQNPTAVDVARADNLFDAKGVDLLALVALELNGFTVLC